MSWRPSAEALAVINYTMALPSALRSHGNNVWRLLSADRGGCDHKAAGLRSPQVWQIFHIPQGTL